MTHANQIHTTRSLALALAACGLQRGQSVLVHSSLRTIGGWICGGAEAVIYALLDVLGPDGTLMMPTHTSNNSDPAQWSNPPVPEDWWPVIRAEMPPFDPATSITRNMGILPETFRRWPGTMRSEHPLGSFAARGPQARFLTHDHALTDIFGDRSPVGRLYALDGWVLLLGVGHENNTSLHLAEHRAEWPGKRRVKEASAMRVDGVRQWVEYDVVDISAADFVDIGAAYEARYDIQRGYVGAAETRLIRQRNLVDFAVEWIAQHRQA